MATLIGEEPDVGLPLMPDLVADLRKFSENPLQRIPWGIPSLDLITEGPAPGEVHLTLGRSFSGKSLVMHNIMVNNRDKGCIFFSLEMPARQALSRMFATYANLDHHAVQGMTAGNTLPQALEEMAVAMQRQVIIDEGDLGLGDMSAYVSAYDRTFGRRPDFVLVDYIELLGGGMTGEGWQRTEAIARGLKQWAKRELMPVFAVHQMNMTVEVWKPPTQSSSRGAGYTEADVVVGIWKPWEDPELGSMEARNLEHVYHMNVLKNRVTGRTTRAPIRCKLMNTLRLQDLSILDVTA